MRPRKRPGADFPREVPADRRGLCPQCPLRWRAGRNAEGILAAVPVSVAGFNEAGGRMASDDYVAVNDMVNGYGLQ